MPNRLHRRNRRRRLINTLFVVSALSCIAFLMIHSLVKTSELKNDNILTKGTIIGTFSNHRNTGGGFEFVFSVNGIRYEGSTAYPQLSPNFCKRLIGKTFPVVYSSKDFTNSKVLILRHYFERYGQIQPDTLKWIERYARRL